MLSIGQSKFIQPLSPVWAFGEQMTEFTVPEFTPGTKGDVAVTTEGHQRQFSLELNPPKNGMSSSSLMNISTSGTLIIKRRWPKYRAEFSMKRFN